MIATKSLTEMQQSFVNAVVFEGKNLTQAAAAAGYSTPKQSGFLLSRNPKIISFLRQERQKFYQTDLAGLAAATLKDIMKDPDAPAAARVSAARSALELAGDLNKHQGSDLSGRSLAELTPDELAGLIDRWEGERATIAKDVTPQAAAEETGTAAIE